MLTPPVMRVGVVAGFVLSMSCGGAPCPPAAEPEAPTASCAEATVAPPEPASARCAGLVDPPPAPAPAEPPPAPATCADNAAGERAMQAMLEREYHRSTSPSRVDVSFDCDPLGAEIRALELVHQVDYMVSSTFTVARLERGAEGDVAVRAIRMHLPTIAADEMTWTTATAGSFTRFTGTIPRAAVDRAIPSLRAALVARLREVELPRPPRTRTVIGPRIGAIHGPFSVRLIDEAGRALVRGGTTSTSGPGQREWLGPTVAMRELFDLLEAHAAWVDATRAPEDAPLLRAVLDAPRAEPWGGAGYLALAQAVGWDLPARELLAVLQPAPHEQEIEPRGPLGVRHPFLDRERAIAVADLVRRSGVDPRNAADGTPRTIADVSAALLRECGAGH